MTRADAMAYLSQHVETALGAFDTRAGTADARRVVTHHRLGDPSTEIVQLAADLDASLVVIGTHGRRGIRRLVMGSVAETVVRLAPCPVLVVRAMDLQQVPQIEPPCPACVAQRQRSAGAEMWCAQHKDSHARRHMFHYVDRNTAAAVDTLSPAGR